MLDALYFFITSGIHNIMLKIDVAFHGVSTRVFRAEYLCAVALETGREKDYLRVKLFLEQDAVDKDALQEIVQRYGLKTRLAKLQEVN